MAKTVFNSSSFCPWVNYWIKRFNRPQVPELNIAKSVFFLREVAAQPSKGVKVFLSF